MWFSCPCAHRYLHPFNSPPDCLRTNLPSENVGAETEPEVLEYVFKSVGLIIQHLIKLITPDLAKFLRHSSRLRYHVAPHVRQLAASTLSYLLRHATTLQLRSAVRTVFAGKTLASHIPQAQLASSPPLLPLFILLNSGLLFVMPMPRTSG